MVYVLMAEGFEEIEALTPVDLLRRAGVEVALVGVSQSTVKGAHGIAVQMDMMLSDVKLEDTEMVVLPGGMGSVDGLLGSADALTLIEKAAAQGSWVAAICAAPTVLAYLGLLDRRSAVCYPTMEGRMGSAVVKSGQRVVTDGRFITAQAAGSSIRFAAKLISVLKDTERADKVMDAILY